MFELLDDELLIRDDTFDHIADRDHEEFVKEFTAEVNRLARVTRQIDRLVEAILGGADALAVNTKLKELEARKAALTDRLGATPDAEPLLHPALATIYRDKVARRRFSISRSFLKPRRLSC